MYLFPKFHEYPPVIFSCSANKQASKQTNKQTNNGMKTLPPPNYGGCSNEP